MYLRSTSLIVYNAILEMLKLKILTIPDIMYLDVFIYFLISLLQSSLRISPGQGQNNQTFGGSLVSVRSIEKVTSTLEQVQKYCNWRKESSLRL